MMPPGSKAGCRFLGKLRGTLPRRRDEATFERGQKKDTGNKNVDVTNNLILERIPRTRPFLCWTLFGYVALSEYEEIHGI